MEKEVKVKEIISYFNVMHVNDPRFSDWFDELVELFSENEEDTIHIFLSLDKNAIWWLTSMFEDVSARLKSEKFIQCLKDIEKKYPDIDDINEDIQVAINILEELNKIEAEN